MAGIIIAILKIMGILLLILVGLVLLAVCAVLFCPVRYNVDASKEAEVVKAVVKGSYLFPIIRFQGRYESGQEVSYSLKILFFTLYPPREKVEKIEKPTKFKRKKKAKQPKETVKEKPKEQSKEQPRTTEKIEKVEKEEINFQETNKLQGKKTLEPDTNQKKGSTSEETSQKEEKPSPGIIERWKNKKDQICNKAKRAWKGMKKAGENVTVFREFITSDETKEVLRFLNQQRKYLFKKIKPEKCRVYLKYGFEDPELTGEVMGLYSVINPFLWGDIAVEPDFEEVVLEGKVTLKGSVRMYGFLLTAFRCYRQETIRKYIDRI